MPKSKDSFKELQRLLGRLTRLEGLLVATTRGPYLVQPEAVLDPRPLLESFQVHGAPTPEALSSWLEQTEGRYPQEKLNLFWMRELLAKATATDGEASVVG